MVERLATARRDQWEALGIGVDFRAPTPDERRRVKFSASVRVDSATAIGELAVWTSGEAELTVAYLSDGRYRVEVCEVNGEGGLNDCLDALTNLMVNRPPDGALHAPPPST